MHTQRLVVHISSQKLTRPWSNINWKDLFLSILVWHSFFEQIDKWISRGARLRGMNKIQMLRKQLTKIKLEIWRTLLTAMLFKVDWKGRWHDVRKRKCARGFKTDKLLIWPADKMSYSSFGWKEYLYFFLFYVLISCQHKWTGYGRSKPRDVNREIEIYLILAKLFIRLTKTFCISNLLNDTSPQQI